MALLTDYFSLLLLFAEMMRDGRPSASDQPATLTFRNLNNKSY
jgi:hypothetical protein